MTCAPRFVINVTKTSQSTCKCACKVNPNELLFLIRFSSDCCTEMAGPTFYFDRMITLRMKNISNFEMTQYSKPTPIELLILLLIQKYHQPLWQFSDWTSSYMHCLPLKKPVKNLKIIQFAWSFHDDIGFSCHAETEPQQIIDSVWRSNKVRKFVDLLHLFTSIICTTSASFVQY